MYYSSLKPPDLAGPSEDHSAQVLGSHPLEASWTPITSFVDLYLDGKPGDPCEVLTGCLHTTGSFGDGTLMLLSILFEMQNENSP